MKKTSSKRKGLKIAIATGLTVVVALAVVSWQLLGESFQEQGSSPGASPYATEQAAFGRPMNDTKREVDPAPPLLSLDELQQGLAALDGSTSIRGFGGYLLDANHEAMIRSALAGFDDEDYTVGFVMMDITTGYGVAYNVDEEFYSASSIKGVYCTSLIAEHPEAMTTYADVLSGMISYSGNEEYLSIRMEYWDDPIEHWSQAAGMEASLVTEWYPYYSAKTLAKLWLKNYEFFENRNEITEEVSTWYEATLNSAIHKNLGQSHQVFSKGGWIADEEEGFFSAIDAGIVYAGEGGSKPYVLVVMSDAPGSVAMLDPLVVVLNDIHDSMWP